MIKVVEIYALGVGLWGRERPCFVNTKGSHV